LVDEVKIRRRGQFSLFRNALIGEGHPVLEVPTAHGLDGFQISNGGCEMWPHRLVLAAQDQLARDGDQENRMMQGHLILTE
jgi:hypothetical protein